MMSKEIEILPIALKDLEVIRNFVVSLAIFEKEPDAVVATLAEYEKSFVNEDIFIYKATLDGAIVGMALYYYTFSTWQGRTLYLEDFIIEEKHRSKGIGKLLFDKVVATAKQAGCRQMKWQVLDWNERAVQFYEKEGAFIDKHWWNGVLQFEA